MNTHMKTDIWIYYLVSVLGLTAATSAIGIIILTMIGWSVPNLFLILGLVAVSGLLRLLISPLNQDLFE